MKTPLSANERTTSVSRRRLLQTATAAAVSIGLAPTSKAMPTGTPIEYGTRPGTDLNEKTIFPLLAAWLLITTSGDPIDSLNEGIIACVANVGPKTAQTIKAAYQSKSGSFDDVRGVFSYLAKQYALPHAPYSGGQCPDNVNTLRPVAALLGTSTRGDCKRKSDSSSKKK
jgi:hypothetical protein